MTETAVIAPVLKAVQVACTPEHAFEVAWLVDPDAASPTEVEVRFVAEDGGTRVELEHRHWERLGASAGSTRENYESGWEMVLGRFVTRLA
jgi:hypothetical protein